MTPEMKADRLEMSLVKIHRVLDRYMKAHQIREAVTVDVMGFKWNRERITSTISDRETQELLETVNQIIRESQINYHVAPQN